MKKKYSLLSTITQLTVFLCMSIISFGQDQMSRENTVLSGGNFDLDDNIIVYERPPDIETDNDNPGSKSGKKYYYIPVSYQIEKINNRPNIKMSADLLSIRVNILPAWPEKNMVVSRIARGGINPLVLKNNVAPLSFYDVRLGTTNTVPGNILSFGEHLPNASNLSEAFTCELTFANKEACVATYHDILDGSLKLWISFAARFWNKTGYRFDLNLQDLFNSNAYRDFISPVEGNTIWLFKLQECRSAIESQLKTRIIREGVNPILEGDLQKFWEEYFQYKTIIIAFDSLSENAVAHRQLTDFHGLTRYQTDEIRKLAQDAESMSDYDFYHKYHNELKKILNETYTNNKKAGGKFGFKQILNIGGDYDSQKSNTKLSELHKIVDDEKKLRKYFKESFHYEMEGNVYKPKGIIAKEIIKSSDVLNRSQNQVSIMYTQGFEYKTYSIKL